MHRRTVEHLFFWNPESGGRDDTFLAEGAATGHDRDELTMSDLTQEESNEHDWSPADSDGNHCVSRLSGLAGTLPNANTFPV